MNASTRNAPKTVTAWPLVACMALTVGVSTDALGQSRFSEIVVFGTSLSDPGNAFALSSEAATPPMFTLSPLLVPSAPYAKGGHHFSNGATWVEQLARPVGLDGSVRPAWKTTESTATNFAVGGARARDDGTNVNLTRQVDEFLLRSRGVASGQALYVIEMGSNDVRDALEAYGRGADGAPILRAALESIAANIQRLSGAGARNYLIWVLPNVALTPAIRALGPPAGAVATFVTQSFNAALGQIVGQLQAVLPGNFFALDAYELLNAVVAHPDAFGLTTVTTACVTPNLPPFSCKDADGFLFWDGIHPTREGHAILAQEAARVLR